MADPKSPLENMVISPNFWRGKKVLITGHTGFKGSWLALWLQSMGANVIGYALAPPTPINLFTLTHIAEHLTAHISGDVRDFASLKAAIAEHRPEIIFHLAAQSLVLESYANPVETYMTNVMGTVHLFEAVRQVGGVKAIVNITSDKCYANNEWWWGYREHEPMGGFDPYSNSKACAELVTSAYQSSYFNSQHYAQHGVGLASARAGNVIGGGDWAKDRLIPEIIAACLQEHEVILRNPQAIRPWQHVLEPLAGYLLLAERLVTDAVNFAEPWNFGPADEDAKPVVWITERLQQLWGIKSGWKVVDNKQHEAMYLKLDCSKARSKLGWQPRWNLQKALQAIVHWYRAYQKQHDMREVTLEQIQSYQHGCD